MAGQRRQSRLHLRIPMTADVVCAWGYERQRCAVTEYSTHGLTVRGLEAPVGTSLTVELDLPRGTFAACGVVVHSAGSDGASGLRLLPLPPTAQDELELFLWELIAADALPKDPNICEVVGCDRPRKARGLCSRHYNRWRRLHARDRG